MYLYKLCQEPVFTLVMQGRVDMSKAKPVEVIVACMRTGNCTGLQYALAQGWVADKQALSQLAAKHNIAHTDVLTWLHPPLITLLQGTAPA